jgi:glycogen synthase
MTSTSPEHEDYKRPMHDLLDLFVGPEADQQLRLQIQKRLEDARKVDPDTATIVVASWENQFAAAGGVRAVTQEYAKHLTSKNRTVLVVTPLHTGLGIPPGTMRPPVAVLWCNFGGVNHRVEVYETTWKTVKWRYLHCDGFFKAEGGRDRSNPYLYEHDAQQESLGQGSPHLVRDCLFYAAVLPRVLCALDTSDNVILHLQDWETAAVALSMKYAILRNEIARAISVLALHNPYDKGLKPSDLRLNGWALLPSRPEREAQPLTFLSLALPLLDAPPATVSREFAVDLVTDPLQTTHLADHLQICFKHFGVKGVDNGPFEKLNPPFTSDAINEAKSGNPDKILTQKHELRKVMKDVLGRYHPAEAWGSVDFTNLKEDVPVFMCVGRLDPGQKGFDVTTRAIEKLLAEGLDARFVLTPIIGDASQPFIDDLKRLANTSTEQVVVYPIRMRHGYSEAQAGCTFSLWPSMYEPFGGVSEFLLRGTPVIARSTGGLRQQVVDFDPDTGIGNGILYETAKAANGKEWRDIQRAEDPLTRMSYPIYADQVEQLANAIRKAVDIFRKPGAYGILLGNTYDSVAGYSWDRAAEEYKAIYRIACK